MSESKEEKESKAVDIEFVFGDETKSADSAGHKEISAGGAAEGSAESEPSRQDSAAMERRRPRPAVDLAEAPADLVSGSDSPDVEQLKSELERYKETALRAAADLDNYRKRMAREKEDTVRYANFGFLERLIPILDNFELGLQAAKMDSGKSGILDGMKMVFKQLQDFLSSCGVEIVDATGQHFDPKVHEAIAQEESNEFPEGMVIRQLRKGYKLKDRLIRPANVVVSKGAPASLEAEAKANR
jgi:molecular chaperone GrpE